MINHLESIANNPELNALSQSLRIAGSAAALVISLFCPKGPIACTALLISTIAPHLRLPFHVGHAAKKAHSACGEMKEGQSRLAAIIGSFRLALFSARILLAVGELLFPLSAASSLIGIALPYLSASETIFSIGAFLKDRPKDAPFEQKEWLQLCNSAAGLGVSLALLNVSPIPNKSLISSLSNVGFGVMELWSLTSEVPADEPSGELSSIDTVVLDHQLQDESLSN